MSGSQLWQTLSEAGLVSSAMPETNAVNSPWYIDVLMAFLGSIAAVFLLGFIFDFFGILDTPIALFIVGSLMIGGAYLLLRNNQAVFAEYFSLTVSLAGQVLVLWGLFLSNDAETYLFWFTMMTLHSALAFFMPGAVHRVFSAYFACIAFIALLTLSGAQHLGAGLILGCVVWLWLAEFRYVKYMPQIRSVGYGLVLALLTIKGLLLVPFFSDIWWSDSPQPDIWVQPWAGQLLSGLVLVYLAWQLLHRRHCAPDNNPTPRTLVAGLGAAVIIAAASFEAAGVIVGIVILLLGFVGSNRVLFGLGGASLLFYISAYYYLLDNTLLVKSMSLLSLAIVLFGCRFCLNRLVKERPVDA